MQGGLFLCPNYSNMKRCGIMHKQRLFNLAFIGTIVLLAGCNQTATETGPGGVSKDDARALDAAAEILDAEPPLPVIPVPQPEAKDDKGQLQNK
jgi:hypothetical protein